MPYTFKRNKVHCLSNLNAYVSINRGELYPVIPDYSKVLRSSVCQTNCMCPHVSLWTTSDRSRGRLEPSVTAAVQGLYCETKGFVTDLMHTPESKQAPEQVISLFCRHSGSRLEKDGG